ncbi:IclR family transcriptional regulator [Marinobacter sp.]|jgi:DNA-binding IclR family transcriptional regulator|uniref:IclR family transcriptional regulator n=1 Tax=Marinobacter sp. TaxID=50741 RepID=UPI000C64A9BA|nr:IclR family transcriptional regulator [Marinobacter sp.]MBE93729.1 IclR family transcriptional regulator [Marinobacter sp.]MBP55133.1 IclR family transcriptional regulator [Marinobacter sp.]|tara:strand:+ start:340 stop:1146 length:807 start_codon:yes stop_codon:yes gene_type:complete
MTEESPKRQGIGSLEIGLHILNYISVAPRPPTLKELSGALDLSPSRAHKYLVSLLREGYINQVNQTQYTLGNSSLTLGISALRRINPIQLSYEALDRLNEETDKTVSVTVWNGNGPLVIKWLDSSHPIAVNVRLGAELSPLNSASGRIYLAHLPDQRRRELVDSHYKQARNLPRHKGRDITRERLGPHLNTVKRDGYCAFFSDYLPEINVLSMPVYDINGSIVTVITLLGLDQDTDIREGSELFNRVLECSNRVTHQICGHQKKVIAG